MCPTSSAISQCLLNADILGLVFSFNSCETWESKRDFANVALVCKEFAAPALDELWRTTKMKSLLSLFSQRMLGRSNADEWTRFDVYARRIRSITLTGNSYDDPIHSAVYVRIATEHPTPLLPCVRTLICRSVEPANNSLLLITRSLRLVQVDIDDHHELLIFLSALVTGAPDLEALMLHGDVDLLVPDCMTGFSKLQTLELRNMESHSPRAFLNIDDLMSHSNVTHYSLTTLPDWDPALAKHTFVSGFGGLESLTIEGGFHAITAVIFRVTSLSVSCVQINCTDRPHDFGDGEGWSPLIDMTLSRWASTLQVICLENLYLDLTQLAVEFSNIFASLDSLPALRRFTLANYLPILVRDADVCKLATCCPALEWIAITVGSTPSSLSLLTTAALFYLAQNCPRPTRIQIHINAVETTAMPAVPPHRALRHLTIQGMDWTEAGHRKAKALARYLDRLFPQLETVDRPESQDKI
ncbi:hypothetical protein C8J57DRAFT_1579026 [Mycena rebaudengoi]|nr:hypothetical protein C8J57DRAFT_1579026 [Mycena rebaudengoi]